MTTLGERLKQIIENDERKGLEKQRINEERDRKRVERERSALIMIFSDAFEEADEAINEGCKPNGKVVKGYGMPFNYSVSISPDDPKHPYHDIYLHWQGIATESGLKLYIRDEHEESWHRVIFGI